MKKFEVLNESNLIQKIVFNDTEYDIPANSSKHIEFYKLWSAFLKEAWPRTEKKFMMNDSENNKVSIRIFKPNFTIKKLLNLKFAFSILAGVFVMNRTNLHIQLRLAFILIIVLETIFRLIPRNTLEIIEEE